MKVRARRSVPDAASPRVIDPAQREAVAKTAEGKPVELMIRNGEFYSAHKLDYKGGERYPHLVRDNAVPDLLSNIIQAKAK